MRVCSHRFCFLLVLVFVGFALLLVQFGCFKKQPPQPSAGNQNESGPRAATKTQIEDRVRTIVAKQLSINPSVLDLKRPLNQLGADELDVVEIILEIEVEFNTQISDAEIGDAEYKKLSTEKLIDIVLRRKLTA